MADDVLNLAGRFHSTAYDNKALDAIEVFDSTRDDKRQKHFNDDIVRLDEQINNTDGLKDRLEAVEDMASIQVDGGDVQIASTIAPSTEGGKIPTVDAVKGHATAKSTFTTGESVDSIGIDSEPAAGSDNLVKSRGIADVYGSYMDNPEFAYVLIDNKDKILCGIKTDGEFFFGVGCPQQVKDYIEEKIADLSLDEYEDIVAFLSDYLESDTTLKIMIDEINDTKLDKEGLDHEALATVRDANNLEYIQVTTDNEDKILEGITSNGYKEIDIPIKTPSFDIEHINSSEWLDVKIDNEGKVLRGMKSNGVYSFGTEIESPTIDNINKGIKDLGDKVDELSDIPFFPFVKCERAWFQNEKKSKYEAWPFANCFYDTSTGNICVAINEREKHSDTNNTGSVWFRKKKENKDFGDWILIANNLDGIGKRTHATGICANGDYISFVIFQEIGGNGLDGTIHLFRSQDKGDSWVDEGAIEIDGVELQSDQVSGLYLTESGRLITASHKGANIGTTNTFVMYSDDNGLTWTKSVSSVSVMNTNDQECSWCEINGTLFMVTRRTWPYLYYSEDNGVTWTYSGRFNFENKDSPTSITRLPNGNYLIMGGNRAVSKNGEYPILLSVVDEAFFTKGEETPIAPVSLIKFANSPSISDYSYTQAVITDNGMLYCYYYDRSKETSTSAIVSYYELKGTILGL